MLHQSKITPFTTSGATTVSFSSFKSLLDTNHGNKQGQMEQECPRLLCHQLSIDTNQSDLFIFGHG